ncbi:hypothetical protein GCM10007158_14800 [Vreelandella hamiltonii]|uniref:hydroxymethylpyrimidine kinase n=1 Tax=Halomonas johnsoniae TaxID=502832 RepID=A0ABQ2WI30_9GAMM|nr:hypothetical protein GCM10007158_14800 [Halomonas johnsoniae]
MIANVLTIAGSDPSGGAGIQADLKTFSALGTYGTSVITALTAQNTCGVAGVHGVPVAAIRQQLEHLLADVHIDAVKIGMVASRDVAQTIADVLQQRRPRWIVLDPVMVAKSGDVLVDDAGIRAVRDILVPLADVITPNLPEAAVLLDRARPASLEDMESLLPALVALGAPYVVLKGGASTGRNLSGFAGVTSGPALAGRRADCYRQPARHRLCAVIGDHGVPGEAARSGKQRSSHRGDHHRQTVVARRPGCQRAAQRGPRARAGSPLPRLVVTALGVAA